MLRAPLRVSVLLVATAVALAGCGVRGSLDTPSANGAGAPPATQGTAAAESGQGKKEGEAPKPHQGFILDRLIR